MNLLVTIIMTLFLLGQAVIFWLLYRRNQRISGHGQEAKWVHYYHNGMLALGVIVIVIGFCSLFFYGGARLNVVNTVFYCLVVDFCAYEVKSVVRSK